MRSSAVLFLASVSACASSGTVSEQPATPQTFRIVGSVVGGSQSTTATVVTVAGELPFPIERVWAILPSVYDSLGVAPAEVNAATRVVGNSDFNAYRDIAAVPLSQILDCGTTQGGPSAETYEIVMTIRTQLRAAGASATTIATALVASGKPVSFAGNYVKCTSKTTLEQRIFDTVRQRLSAS